LNNQIQTLPRAVNLSEAAKQERPIDNETNGTR